MLLGVNTGLAGLDQRARSAQHARRRPANLNVGVRADRRELEHRVEGCNLEPANVRHAQHVGDVANGRFRQPAADLLLRAPQQRNNGRSLLAFRKLGDLRLGPGEIFVSESEVRRLVGM